MKKLTMTLITVQTHLTPNKIRLMMFGFALLVSLVAPGRAFADDFNAGGCGGG